MAELKIISMDEVPVEEVEWLWYPYIPFGKLSIIETIYNSIINKRMRIKHIFFFNFNRFILFLNQALKKIKYDYFIRKSGR